MSDAFGIGVAFVRVDHSAAAHSVRVHSCLGPSLRPVATIVTTRQADVSARGSFSVALPSSFETMGSSLEERAAGNQPSRSARCSFSWSSISGSSGALPTRSFEQRVIHAHA
jgi:hypothetical protein